MFHFTQLDEKDYDDYLKLIQTFRPTSFSRLDFTQTLYSIGENTEIWVLWKQSEIVGTISILFETKFIHDIGHVAHVEDVCLSPNFRGQRLGDMLLDKAKERAIAKNCYKLNLYCDSNLEKFYERNGYITKGIQMSLYLEE